MSGLLIVAATREDQAGFAERTPLGRSLPRLIEAGGVSVSVITGNRRGLPIIYNRKIAEEHREKILVFVHDDVFLDDYHLPTRLAEALVGFDLVGVAGNERRAPRQPSWFFVADEPQLWQDRPMHLRGSAAHGPAPDRSRVTRFGPAPADCLLLDGVLLAARCSTLLDRGVRFDEQFDFHFYDLDFCRTAAAAGLRLGCWPIAVTHASAGDFRGEAWRAARDRYFAKWGD